jgi:hypothetical protein
MTLEVAQDSLSNAFSELGNSNIIDDFYSSKSNSTEKIMIIDSYDSFDEKRKIDEMAENAIMELLKRLLVE